MADINIVEDMISVTKLRSNFNKEVARIKGSERPLVVLADSEAVAVLLSPTEYQRLSELAQTAERAETRALMRIAAERSKDVMSLEECIDSVYKELNLPRPVDI
jgi:PHD/YefM family antitoxin component YafN of YafNO toxin-antitoxin module